MHTAKLRSDNSRELNIARNFVLQYYTFLNKAPHLAHRFYSNDSTLIHGSLEKPGDQRMEPVVGLQKIKQKLDDLKFCDCRVKVRQIDSLATLNRGLLIQVIGELSNNGEPMRRFVQTFVLAPGPNKRGNRGGQSKHNKGGDISSDDAKFYVLNDIFRYQDDRYDEEDYNPNDLGVDAPITAEQAQITNYTAASVSGAISVASVALINSSKSPAPKSSENLAASVPAQQTDSLTLSLVQHVSSDVVPPVTVGVVAPAVATSAGLAPPAIVPTSTSNVTPPASSFSVPSSNEPKTWANRVLRGTPGVSSATPAPLPSQPSAPAATTTTSSSTTSTAATSTSAPSSGSRVNAKYRQ